jgi:hypothetical protein
MPGILEDKFKININFVTLKNLNIIKIIKLFINYNLLKFLR